MKWPDPFVSYVSQAFSPASKYCSTNKGVFMICWFGLFLAEIRPSQLEEGISLNIEKNARFCRLKILKKDP